MQVEAQVPDTGTRLRLDADRQFESQQGDSVLRVQGQTPDGSPVFDAVYVEVTGQEARAVALLAEFIQKPPAQVEDAIAQEVQAAFSSRLTGRDAQQVAHIAHLAIWQALAPTLGIDPRSMPNPAEGQNPLRRVIERFQRAAAKKQAPWAGAQGYDQQPDSEGSSID